MVKTIKQFLQGEIRRYEFESNRRAFFLDDLLEQNPEEYCPSCSHDSVTSQRKIEMTQFDYECDTCGFKYSILFSNRKEFFGERKTFLSGFENTCKNSFYSGGLLFDRDKENPEDLYW